MIALKVLSFPIRLLGAIIMALISGVLFLLGSILLVVYVLVTFLVSKLLILFMLMFLAYIVVNAILYINGGNVDIKGSMGVGAFLILISGAALFAPVIAERIAYLPHNAAAYLWVGALRLLKW